MCDSRHPSPAENEEESVDESEGSEESSELDNSVIVRAKWMFDGARTLDEIVEKLRNAIEYYTVLKNDGWELLGPVDDDYGFIKQQQPSARADRGLRE